LSFRLGINDVVMSIIHHLNAIANATVAACWLKATTPSFHRDSRAGN